MNLKEAIAQGKLDEFIKEHQDKVGDSDKLDAAISSMVHKSKEAPATSDEDDSER